MTRMCHFENHPRDHPSWQGRVRNLRLMVEAEVERGVVILEVEVRDAEVVVDVYGGESLVCGSLIYRFDDEKERQRSAAQLRRWRDGHVPLTYTKLGAEVVLVEDALSQA
jgi:hypothetical protein